MNPIATPPPAVPARKGWSLSERLRNRGGTSFPHGSKNRGGRPQPQPSSVVGTLVLIVCVLLTGVGLLSTGGGRDPQSAALPTQQRPEVSLDGVVVRDDAIQKAAGSVRDSVHDKASAQQMERSLANPRLPDNKNSTGIVAMAAPDDNPPISTNNTTDPDTYEFGGGDNSASTASIISLNSTQQHTLAPDLTDVDWVTFTGLTPTTSTTAYTIYTNNLEPGVDTLLRLYDANGTTVLLSNNNDPNNTTYPFASRITFSVTSSLQRFYAQVLSNSTSAAVGAYTLRLELISTVTPTTTVSGTTDICYDKYEPDSTPERARLLRVSSLVPPQLPQTPQTGVLPVPTTPPISALQNDPASQLHSICGIGDQDWVYFDLVRGKQYSIMTSNLNGGLDSFIVLYRLEQDGSLTPLYANDDAPGYGLASRIDFTAPLLKVNPTGTFQRYYLAIKDVANHGRKDMQYWLTLSTLGEPSGACLDTYEPDNKPGDASEILLNETQARTFCLQKDVDWIKFYAKSNATYVIDTLALSPIGVDDNLTLSYVAFDTQTGAVIRQIDLETVDDLPDGSVMGRIYFRPDQYADIGVQSGFTDIGKSGYYYVALRNVGDIGQPGLAYQVRMGIASSTQLAEAPAFIATARGNIGATVAALTATAGGGLPPVITTAPGTPATTTITNAQQTVNAYNTAVAQTAYAGTQTAIRTDSPAQTAVAATLTAQATPRAITDSSQVTPGVGVTSDGIVRAGQYADASFLKLWSRADAPVLAGTAGRSWLWGAKPGAATLEQYAEATGGTRQVQYFDKARMEINQPKADRSSAWFVTNGLLVREMVSGTMALGDKTGQSRAAAAVPVAGDPIANVAPVYAAFRSIISLDGSNRATDRTGILMTTSFNAKGEIGTIPHIPGDSAAVVGAAYVAETGHNIPAVFWEYMHRQGQISVDGHTATGAVMDWLPVMGLPISEPYWIRATVGGQEKDVLVQLFERRSLTYTPSNDPAWQVEMGNVGRHYYAWRYGAAWSEN